MDLQRSRYLVSDKRPLAFFKYGTLKLALVLRLTYFYSNLLKFLSEQCDHGYYFIIPNLMSVYFHVVRQILIKYMYKKRISRLSRFT